MTPWFWIRGLMREAEHWGELPAQFEKLVPGARVHRLDVPGNGTLYQESTPLSVTEIVDYLDKKTTTLQTGAEKPFLLSMSFGSMIALEWLSRSPEKFAGAVLINTSIRGTNPLHHRLRPAAFARLLQIAVDPRMAVRERKILELTSNSPDGYEQNARRWETIQQEHPVSIGNAIRQLLAAARFAPRAAGTLPPLLILQSQKDRLVDPRCGQALQKKLGGSIAFHPWAGHDLPLDDGAWMIERIKDWLPDTNGLK